MLDPRLRLRHLNCFLEIARLGSLSAAAQALHISQPAASKTLKELETLLDTALFARRGRGLELTAAGKMMQQQAGAALGQLEQATEWVRGRSGMGSKIAVGALPSASSDLLPRAALSFHRQSPNCRMRVSTGPNWLLLSQLREGALDMVVGRPGSVEAMEGLSFRQLYSEHVQIIARPGHPLLASSDPIPALSEYPLILPPKGAVISSMVRGYLMRQGHGDVIPAFDTVSFAFGRALVQQSDALWFISAGVVRQEVDEGALCALPMGDTVLGGPVGISMRDAPRQTPDQNRLFEILVTTAQTLGKGESDQYGSPI